MAVNHALHTSFKPTELDADELQLALVKHVPYAVETAAEAAALDLTGLGTLSLILGTDIFWYDATDTTTVHDGVTCLVTTDGKRFKADGTRVNGAVIYAVDDDDLTAPPGGEAIGDSFLLPAAPTGDWAAYGKHVAIYTRRGYVFVAPRDGMLVYVSDEDIYMRYNGTAWVAGFGSSAIADGSLKAAKLEQAYGWRVESETATPPGSIPAEGTLYIVGSSATGAWAGEDGNIARSTGAAWEFVDAAEGMTVFNKALGYNVSNKSGSWQVDRPSGLLVHQGDRVAVGSGSSQATTTTVLSLGSRAVLDSANRVTIECSLAAAYGNVSTTMDIGLYVDTETTARDEISIAVANTFRQTIVCTFSYAPGDTASRAYYIKSKGFGSGIRYWENANGILREIAG